MNNFSNKNITSEQKIKKVKETQGKRAIPFSTDYNGSPICLNNKICNRSLSHHIEVQCKILIPDENTTNHSEKNKIKTKPRGHTRSYSAFKNPQEGSTIEKKKH